MNMNISFQSSASAVTGGYVAQTAAGSASGETGAFSAQLMHTMQGHQGTTMSSSAAAEQPLWLKLGQLQGSQEETESQTSLELMIDRLEQQMNGLEELADGQEGMLEELQAWLMQAYVLLASTSPVSSETNSTEGHAQPEGEIAAALIPAGNGSVIEKGTDAAQAALVSQLLSGQTGKQGLEQHAGATAPEETEVMLPAAARHPETIRFALQDALQSLKSLLSNRTGADVQDDAKSQAAKLLGQFAQLMESPKAQNANIPAAGTAVIGNQESAQIPGLSNPAAAANGTHAESDAETGGTASGGSESAALSDAPEITTAGQLALRAGFGEALKLETAQVPVRQFAQEMNGLIAGKLEIVKTAGAAEATISLFPEHLGQVDVKITLQNGRLIAQFVTEHALAKDMLEQQMSQLRVALQGQGLQVDKLEVTQSDPSMRDQLFQDGRGSQAGGQQQERRSGRDRNEIPDTAAAMENDADWREWLSRDGNDGGNGSFTAQA